MCRLEDILISPVQLGILTGILISLFIRYTTTNDENDNIKIELLKWHHVEFRKWFYTIATFLNFLILSPILVTICYLFGIYKRIAGFRLRVNIKKLKWDMYVLWMILKILFSEEIRWSFQRIFGRTRHSLGTRRWFVPKCYQYHGIHRNRTDWCYREETTSCWNIALPAETCLCQINARVSATSENVLQAKEWIGLFLLDEWEWFDRWGLH